MLDIATSTECFEYSARKAGSTVRDNSKRCPKLIAEFIHELHGAFSLFTSVGTKSHILRKVIHQYEKEVVAVGAFDEWSKEIEMYNLERSFP